MDILREGDACSALFLVLVLFAVGSKMAERRPHLRGWGLRIAAAVFVGSVGLGWVDSRPSDSDEMLRLALHGLAIAALALGLAWIGLSVLAFLHQHLVAIPTERAQVGWEARRRRRIEEKARRDAERQETLRRVEYERTAPDRELARQRAEAEARSRIDAQKSRDDARASALLSFTFYSAKLGNRFSRQDFDLYLATYMKDEQPPEVVEQRGRDLLAIFEKLLVDSQPKTSETSLEAITLWYQTTKSQIQALPLDQDVKDVRLAELERRFAELLSEHMERVKP